MTFVTVKDWEQQTESPEKATICTFLFLLKSINQKINYQGAQGHNYFTFDIWIPHSLYRCFILKNTLILVKVKENKEVYCLFLPSAFSFSPLL